MMISIRYSEFYTDKERRRTIGESNYPTSAPPPPLPPSTFFSLISPLASVFFFSLRFLCFSRLSASNLRTILSLERWYGSIITRLEGAGIWVGNERSTSSLPYLMSSSLNSINLPPHITSAAFAPASLSAELSLISRPAWFMLGSFDRAVAHPPFTSTLSAMSIEWVQKSIYFRNVEKRVKGRIITTTMKLGDYIGGMSFLRDTAVRYPHDIALWQMFATVTRRGFGSSYSLRLIVVDLIICASLSSLLLSTDELDNDFKTLPSSSLVPCIDGEWLKTTQFKTTQFKATQFKATQTTSLGLNNGIYIGIDYIAIAIITAITNVSLISIPMASNLLI
ncbi:hypothetical protein ADUPG1_014174 [Aduncisulcus paluster]|uniref:Uncharacterized protein n=1 Tax=Aduncisulcus paluster TaxID=2918883 RepID=A0ABQ5KEC8_9EUKA|nr:hypothetical protein ADUPG1_014174 [Aduncisulcus paluster]